MPKSKRQKVVSLTVVKKKDRAWKQSLIQSIRTCVEEYPSCYVFKCANMRNETFKGLRDELSASSRFFVGGNKLMRAAFGKTKEDEVEKGLAKFALKIIGSASSIAAAANAAANDDDEDDGNENENDNNGGSNKRKKGQKYKNNSGSQNNSTKVTKKEQDNEHDTTTTGVVFTNLSKEDLESVMEEKTTKDFARVGQVATETIVVPEGAVMNIFGVAMSHTLEPTLRKHGLPTKLNKGVVECIKEKTICKKGMKLNADQCALLRQFGYKLATFHLYLKAGCVKETGKTEEYANEEEYLDYGDDDEMLEGDDNTFASDGLPASMMLPAGL